MNNTTKTTTTLGGKNMKKEMKEYAVGTVCWSVVGAALGFGVVVGTIAANEAMKGGLKLCSAIKNKVSDLIESQKLTSEELEEKEVVVEIKKGKNLSEDDDDESEEDSVEEEIASIVMWKEEEKA